MKLSKNQVSKLFIVSLAIAGCGIQLRSTLEAYFQYHTTTRTTTFEQEILKEMSLSICITYADVFDYHALKSSKNIDMTNWNREEKHDKLQDIVTVRDIFDFTPSSRQLISSCHMRPKSTRIRIDSNESSICYEHFIVKRYYTQEFICYIVMPKRNKIPYSTYSTTVDSPGEIYQIGINESISNSVHYLKPIVHRGNNGFMSKKFAAVTKISSQKERFNLKYSTNIIHYLGYPYDNFFCSSEEEAYQTCIEYCSNNRSIKRYNKVVHDLNLMKHYDYKHISRSDILDQETSHDIDTIISYCFRECKNRDCNLEYTMTDHTDRMSSNYLAFRLNAPLVPFVDIQFYPNLKFLDLFVYVMGAIGAWFGFAFIHIDLPSIYNWFKTRLSKQQPLVLYHNYDSHSMRIFLNRHNRLINTSQTQHLGI